MIIDLLQQKCKLISEGLIMSWATIRLFLYLLLKFSREVAVTDVLLLLVDKSDSDLEGCFG